MPGGPVGSNLVKSVRRLGGLQLEAVAPRVVVGVAEASAVDVEAVPARVAALGRDHAGGVSGRDIDGESIEYGRFEYGGAAKVGTADRPGSRRSASAAWKSAGTGDS